MWLNENAGIIVFVLGILIVVMLAVVLWLVVLLNSRFAAQRLKFTGMYAMDMDTRAVYASLTIGNRSVSEIALKELGVKNGNAAFDLTALYKRKAGMEDRAYIVIEQRRSIGFHLDESELCALLVDGTRGKKLKSLRLYAMDLTGNVYEGRIPAVRKLLAGLASGSNSVPLVRELSVTSVPVNPSVRESAVAPAPVAEPEHAEHEEHADHAEHTENATPDAVQAGQIPYGKNESD